MLEAIVAAMVIALPGATPEHADALSAAVADVVGDDRLLAAEVLTVGFFESGYLPRIQAGECRKGECDKGRARGWWQPQRTSFSRDQWDALIGLDDAGIHAGAETAARTLLAGRKACRSVEGTLAWYANGRCSWGGARYRVKLVNRLMAVRVDG